MFPLYQVDHIQEKVKRPPREHTCRRRGRQDGRRDLPDIDNFRLANEHCAWWQAENLPITKELDDLCMRVLARLETGYLGLILWNLKIEVYLVHEVNNTTEFKNVMAQSKVDIPGMIVDYLIE